MRSSLTTADEIKLYLNKIAETFGRYDDSNNENDTTCFLREFASELSITAMKARKIRITAGEYSTYISRKVDQP